MRALPRKKVLRELRKGPATPPEIAAILGLNPKRISATMYFLRKGDKVEHIGTVHHNGRGRNAKLYRIKEAA